MIEQIIAKLSAIPADKVLHFACGTVLFAAALPFLGARYAMAFVAGASVAKEIYDGIRKDRHTPDVWDSFSTTLGGAVAYSCT